MTRIVLVGFPGAGKSTVGKALARKTGLTFLDLDQEMERNYHSSISIFLEKFGEAFFRKCENEMLQKLLQQDNIVLATGGGTPCFYNAMSLINEKATSIYIKLSEESLFVRLMQAKKKRPLITQSTPEELKDYIKKTLKIREPFYRQAHIITKGESINIEELMKCLYTHHQLSDF
jgi:shikimate kinase